MFTVTLGGVTHRVITYDTDDIDEAGGTSCGIRFSLWDGVNGRCSIPEFGHLVVERGHAEFPEGMVRCKWCEGMETSEECCGCSA